MEEMRDQFDRWERILRLKAGEYEHKARHQGKEVTAPSIDQICNEMRAFVAGVLLFKN